MVRLAIFVVVLAFAASVRAREGERRSEDPVTTNPSLSDAAAAERASRPPIDLEAPVRLATATFALG